MKIDLISWPFYTNLQLQPNLPYIDLNYSVDPYVTMKSRKVAV